MSPPAVTRAVSTLEERIGTRLLHRTTRIVRLTEAGTRFLADCKRIQAEIEEAEASAAGSHAELRGPLTVTASVMFGQRYVAPILLDFLARHPKSLRAPCWWIASSTSWRKATTLPCGSLTCRTLR